MSAPGTLIIGILLIILMVPVILLFRAMDNVLAEEHGPKTWVFLLFFLLASVICFVISSLRQ